MQRRLIIACAATSCITATEGFLSVAVTPYLDSLGYSVSLVGLLVSVFSIVAFLSRFPAGLLYRPRLVQLMMTASLLAMALSGWLYPVATDPVPLAVVRALNGAGFGIASTLVLALFMDALPQSEPTHRPMSFFGASLSGGFAAGMGVGGFLADTLGYATAFRLVAVVPLVAFILMLDVFRHVRPRARGAAKAASGLPWRARVASVVRTLGHPEVVTIAATAFLMNFLLQVAMTFFPLYGLRVGLSLGDIGLARSAHSLVQVFSRPLVGLVSARIGHHRLITASLVLLTLASMLIPAFRSLAALGAIFVLLGTLRAIGYVATTISVAEDIPPERMNRGLAATIFNSSKDVGNIAGPLFGGLVASLVGIERVFLLVPPLALCLYLVVLRLARRAHQPATALHPHPG